MPAPQDAVLRRDRQREDDEIDPRHPRELHEIIDRAELLLAGADHGRPIAAAIVEQADDADIGILLEF